MKIYTVSKTRHAPLWKRLRDVSNLPINSTWIDEADEGQTKSFSDLWNRCIREASEADYMLGYRIPTDSPLKGGLVEIGVGLVCCKKVILIGFNNPEDRFSFIHHPKVLPVNNLSEALNFLKAVKNV